MSEVSAEGLDEVGDRTYGDKLQISRDWNTV